MAILTSELRYYESEAMSDASTSGGRITFTQIASAALQNVFPHVFRAERATGNLANPNHRKIFARNINDADESGYNPCTYLFRPNPSAAWVYKVIGTQRSRRSDLTGSETKYGPGLLASGISAGATTIVVTVKHADMTACFGASRVTRISSKATATSTTGTEDEFTPSAISVSGLNVTLTVPAGQIANAYSAGATVFTPYYPAATELACTVSNWVETGAGTYDETTYPVVGDNIGCAEQTWTLTFTSATAYTVSGDTVGSVGSGTVSADFIPQNSAVSKPYFTLRAAGFGGTWAAGNTIVFQTHPPAIPIHEFRCIPAACPSLAGDGITLCLEVETV